MRVMISCGEPSGDLYAGALASEILPLEPSAVITGFGGDRLRAAGASLVGDFNGLSVTGLLEVVRVLPRTYATYRRLVADADADAAPTSSSRSTFPTSTSARARAAQARRAGRLLHQPAALGVAPRPDEDDAPDRRSGAGDLPVRGGDLREAGVPVQLVGHPLLDLAHAAASRGPLPRAPRAGSRRGRWSRCCRAAARNELRAILPDLVARGAASIRARVPGVQFIVARAPHLGDELFAPLDERRSRGTRCGDRRGTRPTMCWRPRTWRSSPRGP